MDQEEQIVQYPGVIPTARRPPAYAETGKKSCANRAHSRTSWQVIVSHRGEHFKCHRIFEDVRAVLDPSGNTPTVAHLGLVFFGANRKMDSAPYCLAAESTIDLIAISSPGRG